MSLHVYGMRLIRWSSLLLFLGSLWSGCASVKVQTAGETPQLRWRATDFSYYTVAFDQRAVYKYTLILEDLQGRDVTFTALRAKLQNNATSPRFNWEKDGRWVLPAHGELRIPLGTYRYCNDVNCVDRGPLAPVWHLTLSGTDSHGQPVQQVIRLRLPYVDETA